MQGLETQLAGVAVVEFEVPSDEEVLKAIAQHGAPISPRALLKILMDSDHNRSNSQLAIQRCIDRGKIGFNLDLHLQCRADRLAA
jgi:hypothetical protein